jgi:hypothetical protein
MKPHPRIHKAIKWGGVAVVLLLLATWNVSKFSGKSVYYRHGGFVVFFTLGTIDLHWADISKGGYVNPELQQGLHLFMAWRGSVHGPFWHSDPVLWQCTVPPELPLAVSFLAVAAAWLAEWRTRRRVVQGRCPACNYDRAGIAADAKCPECGCGGGGGAAPAARP